MTDINPTNHIVDKSASNQDNGTSESWLDINDKDDPRGRLGEGWPWNRPS